MAELKDRNGTVVTVADNRVDRLLAAGFTLASEPKKTAAKTTKRAAKSADTDK